MAKLSHPFNFVDILYLRHNDSVPLKLNSLAGRLLKTFCVPGQQQNEHKRVSILKDNRRKEAYKARR